jgi:hypothetical protein
MRKTRGGTVLALSPNVCLRQNLIRPWGNCQIAGRIPRLRVRRPKGLLAGPVALKTQKGFGKSDRKGDPVGAPLAGDPMTPMTDRNPVGDPVGAPLAGAQNDTAGAPDETAVLGFTTAAV